MGNAWEPGKPVMSTLALRALLAFLDAGQFFLCQQFICYNPARLPTPAQWVNVERIRVKDAFTHLWWMSKAERPEANNRLVLKEYSESMLRLLSSKKYNAGKRPSEHNIGKSSFLRNNAGAIPSNVLTFANTNANDEYLSYCREKGVRPHPARMHPGLANSSSSFSPSPAIWSLIRSREATRQARWPNGSNAGGFHWKNARTTLPGQLAGLHLRIGVT